ncbi:5-(carboxyamino)imidazole ribonucleotide synthase [Echinimonas agarilytica]|uniref:N5-carboxyaminoimidazole ribonucleotide synthase n=1 Tax=Echinimonas agarilytica TaxID=1215918 RepID=A0AA41W3D5_9GAMM|nr:5-(carboxyamino)imidazole ribonucleotide synthase [Echinimonas agarilytica]MCM2678058.1 5-(carboxyamino)imidazole ribonucleotide synthase [Echinimonas agarilytica]
MKVMVLGAGQLAQMMALAGAPLGISVVAYDVRTHSVVHPVTGQDYQQDLAAGINANDVITAEFEHIPHDILDQCQASGKFLPGDRAIRVGGDRRLEKQLLDGVNVPNARYQFLATKADLTAATQSIGLPLVLKSALDGYDGKGQWRLKSETEIDAVWAEIEEFLAHSSDNQSIVAEQWIPFNREVSVIGVRNKDGNIAVYPLTQNHHEAGVLSLSVAPATGENLQQQAVSAFEKIANELDYVGVLAIEFFDVDGQLLVNEIAPRVHNSGHWTQQGADCCQFENHLRAVCNLPLGSTELVRPTAMVNVLGIDSVHQKAMEIAGSHQHWYGKEQRAGRKMGHINVAGKDQTQMLAQLNALLTMLPEAEFPGLSTAIAKLPQ